jgi:catechol-2,3-dioxygenase
MALPKKRGEPDVCNKTKVDYEIDARAHIGHVHLKVANLERALRFYCGVLGFEVMQRFGEGAAFVSAGGYHHHLAMNTWESLGGSPPPAGRPGCITPRLCIRRGRLWRRHCGASLQRGLCWMARRTME